MAEVPLNTIIVGDTLTELKGLPDSFFAVGVTSPPYNKGERHKGWLVPNVVYDEASDRKDEPEYQDEQVAVLNELYRVTEPGGSFFYNHKIRWERGVMLHPYSWVSRSRWVVRQEIIWYRRMAANIRGWRFWQVDERIYWLCKPVDNDLIGEELKSRHAQMTSVWDISPERKINWVPSPFPIELPARCISSVIDDRKGRVIDPYAGSGTTLVAAKLMELDYLGIELSPEYTRRALERLENAHLELPSLMAELERHKVETTFAERKKRGDWDKHIARKQALTYGEATQAGQPRLIAERSRSRRKTLE